MVELCENGHTHKLGNSSHVWNGLKVCQRCYDFAVRQEKENQNMQEKKEW
jgi:hypothetical protein